MSTDTNQNLHPISRKMYFNVFLLLITLTALTILQPLVIHMQLAPTLMVQMGIALIKIVLIVLYYMHIKSSSSIFKKLIFGTIILLIVLYGLMAIDTYVRYGNHDILTILN
ncbi:MAG: cytochrome C oxidase subunit IV family protein [Sulfurospirillaceae bacterium]|nr:cytochrome C oxidase subunit IV family protein [Sulfurospirillaceae bacterium]